MSEMIITKKLLAKDTFMPVMRLRQPGFIYRACGSFAKKKIRIKKVKNVIQDIFIKKNQMKLFST